MIAHKLPKYINLWIALVIFIIIVMGNRILYEVWVDWSKLVAVSAVIIVYFLLLHGSFYQLLIGQVWLKVMALILFLLLCYSLFDVTYYLVYIGLPSMDIVLYDVDSVFDNHLFRKNILSSFTTIVSAAALYTLALYYHRHVFRRQRQIDDLRYRLRLSSSNPHFMQSLFNSALGRSLMGRGPEIPSMIFKLNELIHYVLICDQKKLEYVTIEQELQHVYRFIDILRWKYGDDAVTTALTSEGMEQLTILSLSMLSIVENANKYTNWEAEAPLFVGLSTHGDCIVFEVSNTFDTVHRQQVAGGGFGLSHLKERIERLGVHMSLEVVEKGEHFRTILTLSKNYA